MDANVVDLVKTLGSDLIKIVGPAFIAAFATYKATRSQFEAKLTEIEKTNELSARKEIFGWLKDREKRLKDNYDSISHGIGQALGFASGGLNPNSEDLTPESQVFAELVVFSARLLPTEIDSTLTDMVGHRIESHELTQKLTKLKSSVLNVHTAKTLSILRKDAFTVLEAYTYLMSCNQLILEKQISALFAKYIEP